MFELVFLVFFFKVNSMSRDEQYIYTEDIRFYFPVTVLTATPVFGKSVNLNDVSKEKQR